MKKFFIYAFSIIILVAIAYGFIYQQQKTEQWKNESILKLEKIKELETEIIKLKETTIQQATNENNIDIEKGEAPIVKEIFSATDNNRQKQWKNIKSEVPEIIRDTCEWFGEVPVDWIEIYDYKSLKDYHPDLEETLSIYYNLRRVVNENWIAEIRFNCSWLPTPQCEKWPDGGKMFVVDSTPPLEWVDDSFGENRFITKFLYAFKWLYCSFPVW